MAFHELHISLTDDNDKTITELKLADKLILANSILASADAKALQARTKSLEERSAKDMERVTALLVKRGNRKQKLEAMLAVANQKYAKSNEDLMRGIANQATRNSDSAFATKVAQLSSTTVTEISERVGTDKYYDNSAKLLRVYGRFLDPSGVTIRLITRTDEELFNKKRNTVVAAGNPIETINLDFTLTNLDIRDSADDWVGYNFGNYAVSIISKAWGTYQTIYVDMQPIRNNKSEPYNGYVHPHVEKDGNVCMGNSGKEIITALNDRNYLAAVYIFLNTITKYNVLSPYAPLSNWIANKDDDGTCGCGKHSALACDVSCRSCGVLLPETSDCGQCMRCCASNHAWILDKAIKQTGINRSGCVNVRFL
jgi:hypothetical protein